MCNAPRPWGVAEPTAMTPTICVLKHYIIPQHACVPILSLLLFKIPIFSYSYFFLNSLLRVVTEMLVNVLSLKDDDLSDEGDEKIKPGSGT